MAAGITLQQARDYFIGNLYERSDETCLTIVNVESVKLFSVRVVHTGSDPLGEAIPEDNAFFTMLTVHESGKEYKQLAFEEGGCVRRAATADGRYTEGGKTHPILYSVTRIS
jgi:hypothetical protein